MRLRLVLGALAVVAALSLAGCSSMGSLSMDPVDDAGLAKQASEATSGGDSVYEKVRQRTARRVIRNSPVNLTGVEPPLSTDLAYRRGGTFYNVSSEVVDTQPGVRTVVSFDYNGTAPNASRVAFSDLSRADRQAVKPYFTTPPRHIDDGPERGTQVTYTESERENSVLADYEDDRVVVTYRGETVIVQVEDFDRVTLRTYRYTASLVAGSPAEYAAQLKRQYAFTLRNLNESQRSVVKKAIGGTYYAESADDAAFASLVERFRSHEAVASDEYSGSWVVRYRGRLFWAEMDYGGFVDETGDTVSPPSVTPH
ncbi:MAG: hypothetical protein ABEJ85_02220 [Haloarculaceae archaeon]